MRPNVLLVAMLVGAATLAVAAEPSAAVTPAGGRVQLSPNRGRGTDTRLQPPSTGPVSLYASLGLVYVLDSATSGTATIYPCGGSPGPDPSLVFDAGEIVYAKFASSTPQCIVSSTPAQFVVDTLGGVSDTPILSGLQYVALAAPVVAFEGPVASSQEVRFNLGAPPDGAGGAVLLLESLDPTQPGYAMAYPCNLPRPLTSDLAWNNRRAVGLSYSLLTTGSSDLCSYVYGGTRLRITLLGYLQNDGPDPMSLPPTLNYPIHDAPPPGLRAITPVRLLDTRQPLGVPVAAKLQPGKVLELELGSHVAASTTAVALNVTVTEPDGPGFLTVYPCDQGLPKASNLNYVAKETVPNLVNVKLSITDTVCFYSTQPTHLVVDLTGTFERGGGAGAQSLTPARLLDTRKPIGVPTIGKLDAGHTLVLQVSGRGGVPSADVAAASLNVTVTEPDGSGFITVYPCDDQLPTASNLDFVADQTVPNLVTARLSAAGTVCLFTSATTHLVADVAAWYSVGAAQGYHELPPQRILDTREPIGVPAIGKATGGQSLVLQVSGRGGVPAAGAQAVTMNVTVTEPDEAGFLTVYPCDAGRPEASNLNFTKSQTVPNLVTVKLSASGTVCLFAQHTTHLVADVAGYFTDVPEPLRVGSLTPQA
ncbi:MAG: hypothetical protein ACXVH5_04760 [Ilumatobacteraceae bacterium]